jgi:hypothetical protein
MQNSTVRSFYFIFFIFLYIPFQSAEHFTITEVNDDGVVKQKILTINKNDSIHAIMGKYIQKHELEAYETSLNMVSANIYGQFYTPSSEHSSVRDFEGTRATVLAILIEKYSYQSYLEIGTHKDDIFSLARRVFPIAVGVDPLSGGTLRLTSDEFFLTNNQYFDLIFIDGLHEANQVCFYVLNKICLQLMFCDDYNI